MAVEAPRVVITGGLGFIGVHAVKRWRDEGWNVTVIDNLSANTIDPEHPHLDGVEVIVSDLVDVDFHRLSDVDLVVHLASPVGPVGVLKHAARMASMILADTEWVLRLARQRSCPLIFVSTSEIYGHRDGKTYLREDSDKVLRGDYTVRNEYAIAKLLAEIVVENTAKIDPDLRYQIIRPFNVSGAWQRPENGFVLPRFVNQALCNLPITVYGNGYQLRAFTHVRDIVDGIYRASTAHPSLWCREWNIGNRANEMTIFQLAKKVRDGAGSDSRLDFVDPVQLHGPMFSEAPEKIPDAHQAESLLGWRPTADVDAIVAEVVAFYRGDDAAIGTIQTVHSA